MFVIHIKPERERGKKVDSTFESTLPSPISSISASKSQIVLTKNKYKNKNKSLHF